MQLQKIDTATAVSAIFSSSKKDGFIGIAVRDKGLTIKRWIKSSEVFDYFKKFTQHNKNDIYITSNIFKGGFKNVKYHRNDANLLSLVNIVIDVDFHRYDEATRKTFIKSFLIDVNDAIKKDEIPEFNIVAHTGRGLQFWYTIQSAAAVCKFLFDTATKELITRYEKLRSQENNIFKCYLYDGVDIDYISARVSGLFRLPGSFNTKAKNQYCTVLKNTEYREININEFLSLLGITIVFHTKKHNVKRRTRTTSQGWLHLHNQRKAILEYLHVKIKKGRRDIFCFLYYNTIVQLEDRRKARKDIKLYNSSFDEPLRNSEIASIIKAVDKAGYYKICQDKFYSIAQISNSEREMFLIKYKSQKKKPHSVLERERKYASNKALKLKRDDKIRELALQGKTYTEIQDLLHVARQTISHVLASNKEIDAHSIKKENQMQRIAAMLSEKKSRKEIAAIIGISSATLARRIAEMKKKGMV